MTINKRILIIAAHPDDEILGCGGTVARLIKEGYEAFTLILGEGVTSRDERRDKDKRNVEIEELKKCACNANKMIGIKDVFLCDFQDNRFDTVPLLDIVKSIEKVKRDIKPGVVFTHCKNDLNVDHQITHKAVITATRPVDGEGVREVYSFEVLSSTEWNCPISFSPDVFFDISSTLEIKLNAMKIYGSELKEFPHPRSLEGIKINAGYRGMSIGRRYAEAFENVRVIR